MKKYNEKIPPNGFTVVTLTLCIHILIMNYMFIIFVVSCAVTTQTGDAGAEYTVIVSNQEDQLGLSRSYSDSQVLYARSNGVVQAKPTAEIQSPAKAKPLRPPGPKLFRDLTPSPTPPPEEEDPPYQTPIDALQSPCVVTQDTEVKQPVGRSVSECPIRLVRVRGSSRRKHQPLKRVSAPSPPPMLKSLSLDCLNTLENSDDDYDEIYSNPYDCINNTAAGNKPIHVTACLPVSSAGIPSNWRPSSRQSNSSQSTTPPQGQCSLASNREKSYSAECLDTIELSNNPDATSALLQRRRLRNRHASLDDSVKRLREKKRLQNTRQSRKASMEIQTYPESPQHLKGVGSQENLFFSGICTPTSTKSALLEECTQSTDSALSKKKISNGIDTPPANKAKNQKKKTVQSKPSRGALTNLFKKKQKDT